MNLSFSIKIKKYIETWEKIRYNFFQNNLNPVYPDKWFFMALKSNR